MMQPEMEEEEEVRKILKENKEINVNWKDSIWLDSPSLGLYQWP